MDNANLSLIHPKHQVTVCGGIALLTLAAGTLLTHNEAVKIVATTALSTQLAISLSSIILDHY